MIWTMEPTAKKLEDVETKVGNVGSTDLQSQVTALNNKVGNVGSTDLQSQVTTLNSKLFYDIPADTDFNTLTNSGIYSCPYYSNGPAVHRPNTSGGILMAQRVASGAYLQMYITFANPVIIFTRIYNPTLDWTEWKSITSQ